MIVDTSALCAVVMLETSARGLQRAMLTGTGLIPAPAFVEFRRLMEGRMSHRRREAQTLLQHIFRVGVAIESFTPEDAELAAEAIARWGKGNGGPLNLTDLMVYAVHERTGLPILCTGRDFADTDAVLHPASRRD